MNTNVDAKSARPFLKGDVVHRVSIKRCRNYQEEVFICNATSKMVVSLAKNSLSVSLLFSAARGSAEDISTVWSRAAENKRPRVLASGAINRKLLAELKNTSAASTAIHDSPLALDVVAAQPRWVYSRSLVVPRLH